MERLSTGAEIFNFDRDTTGGSRRRSLLIIRRLLLQRQDCRCKIRLLFYERMLTAAVVARSPNGSSDSHLSNEDLASEVNIIVAWPLPLELSPGGDSAPNDAKFVDCWPLRPIIVVPVLLAPLPNTSSIFKSSSINIFRMLEKLALDVTSSCDDEPKTPSPAANKDAVSGLK
uniref:Uncharacterized protein n=1 Tax=Romanomermis culicivorax TaxID=13658 RepID=A0A915L8J5_ROMCU